MNVADEVRRLKQQLHSIEIRLNNVRQAGGPGFGEINTASNIGAGGVGPYDQKIGVDLQFRNINAGSALITVVLDAPNDEIDIDVDPSQIDLDDLGNVNIAGIANGDIIFWNDPAAEWQVKAEAGGGDVVGPAAATDHAIARFDGVTGKLLQDSPLSLLTDAPILFLNDTSCAQVTIGFIINQGANTDKLVAFKGSHTNHGLSGYETDTYGHIGPSETTNGGLEIMGLSSHNFGTIRLAGLTSSVDTGKTENSQAVIMVNAYYWTGAGIQNATANMNLFGVRTKRSTGYDTVFLVDEDGDVWMDGSLSLGHPTRANNYLINLDAPAANWNGLVLKKNTVEKWFIGMGDGAYGDKLLIRRTGSDNDMVFDGAGNVEIGGGNLTISGHLALGGAAINADYGIHYDELLTDVDNSIKSGIHAKLQVKKTAAVMTSAASAIYGGVYLDSTNTQNWTSGVGLRGIYGQVITEAGSSGTITGAASIFTYNYISDAVTVTNLYGINIFPSTVLGNKVVNEYGIYINDKNQGSALNYAIYTNAGLVYFGDEVGIGTIPETQLHVLTTDVFSLTLKNDTLLLNGGDASGGDYGASIGFTRAWSGINRQAAIAIAYDGSGDADLNGLAFFTHPTITPDSTIVEKMRITSAGNVGIGTPAPAYKFDLLGPTGLIAHFYAENAAPRHQGLYIGIDADTSPYLTKLYSNGTNPGAMAFYTGNNQRMYLDIPGGVFINDTTNAWMTIGLTINQGAGDYDLLAGKSSDIAHGMTGLSETDTFFSVRKFNATAGGATIWGLTEQYAGIDLAGLGTIDNTTKTTAAVSYVQIRAFKKLGSSIGSPGVNANLLTVKDGNTSRFIFDVEGDFFYDGALTNFDKLDDIVACRDAAQILSGQFENFLMYNESALVEMGVLGAPLKQGGLVSHKNLTALQLGAFGQIHEGLKNIEKRLDNLEARWH